MGLKNVLYLHWHWPLCKFFSKLGSHGLEVEGQHLGTLHYSQEIGINLLIQPPKRESRSMLLFSKMLNYSFNIQSLKQLTSLVILNVLQLQASIVAVALCVAGPVLYLGTITCEGLTIFRVIDIVWPSEFTVWLSTWNLHDGRELDGSQGASRPWLLSSDHHGSIWLPKWVILDV